MKSEGVEFPLELDSFHVESVDSSHAQGCLEGELDVMPCPLCSEGTYLLFLFSHDVLQSPRNSSLGSKQKYLSY